MLSPEDLVFYAVLVFLVCWFVAFVHDFYVNVRLLGFIKDARSRAEDRTLLDYAEHRIPKAVQHLDRRESVAS